uniref:Uncharacterized protein n=1 Tax=Romanomermis culicivorax TaxID=13658 RepID=A0A915J340_ROMCU
MFDVLSKSKEVPAINDKNQNGIASVKSFFDGKDLEFECAFSMAERIKMMHEKKYSDLQSPVQMLGYTSSSSVMRDTLDLSAYDLTVRSLNIGTNRPTRTHADQKIGVPFGKNDSYCSSANE